MDRRVWRAMGQKELDMTETTEAPKHKLRNKYFSYTLSGVSQVAVVVKNLSANAGDIRDVGLIPGSGRFPGGGQDNALQYSCLENPMDRGAMWATVHRVAESLDKTEAT